VNRFFDKIFCYGLKDQEDRRNSCLAQFKRHGLDVCMVEAVDMRTIGKNSSGVAHPHIGINRTLVNIIGKCIEENLSNVLILQDDVIFNDDLISVFNENVSNIPEDWNFISLGCDNYYSTKKINGRIHKTRAIVMDHAIGINKSVFVDYIEKLKKEDAESDMSICKLIKDNSLNAYSFVPYVATQGAFYSSYTRRMESEKLCD
jgi:hypothetical protein